MESSVELYVWYFFAVLSPRNRLHEGVIRDVERQQRRKMENIVVLQQQIDLTKQLRGDTKFQDELVSS